MYESTTIRLQAHKGDSVNAPENTMAAFRAAVGLPEKAEDFMMERPQDTPDEIWNEELVKQLLIMYNETVESLLNEPEEGAEGNVNWSAQ